MSNSIFKDTINGIMRERPPVWFMRQAGRILPSYLKLRQKHSFRELMLDPELAAKVTLLPVHDLGVDAAILFSDILVIPEALGMELTFTDKGPIFSTPITGSDASLKSLKPNPEKLNHIYKAIDIIKEKKSDDIGLVGFCGSPFTVFCYMVQGNSAQHSFSNAVNLIYSDRKATHYILDAITELSIEYAITQAEHGIDAFQLFDTHAGLIPSELYFELVIPYVKKMRNALRVKNVPMIFFPKDLGYAITKINHEVADFLSIDWQTSMREVSSKLDPFLGLQGNLDPRIFSTGNKQILLDELEKYRTFGEQEQKWIFNTGHGVLPDNKLENIKFTVEWIKNTNFNR